VDRRQWSAAAPHLAAAVKADPGSEAQLALATMMAAQGDRASALYQRGFYDLATDRPERAIIEFRQMEMLAPDRVDGPLLLSLTDIQMKRLDLAAAEARRGLDRHPHDSRLLERLAELHILGHNRRQVRSLCEGWLQFDPGAAEPSLLLEQIAREEQRLPDALRLGEQALAREPENAAACFQMSKTLSLLPGPANQRRALDLARAAAYRNPREADYWHQLGVLLRGAGQTETAADAWLHALELNPAAPEPCRLLAQVAAQERRPEGSRFFADLATALQDSARTADALWRAVYRRPADAAAHARLARFLLAQGDRRRARYQFQQAAALDPADRDSRGTLAVVERLRALQEE
jgi:tetratricopeptide (TPR) repeat protein